AGLLHEPQKRWEVGGLLLQSRHDPQPHPLLGRGRLFPNPLSIVEKAALAVLLRILNDRQLVLNAHPVREPPHRKAGADEVMEFPGTVLGGGVVINVIVNVALVNVGTDKELILALCPAHGRFIADFVCHLRRDLAGRERLPDLKEQGPALHGPARFRLVLAFQQQELSGGGCRITEIGRHSPQLFRIEPIGKPLLHCLDGRFPSRYLVGPDVGCSDIPPPFPIHGKGGGSGGYTPAALPEIAQPGQAVKGKPPQAAGVPPLDCPFPAALQNIRRRGIYHHRAHPRRGVHLWTKCPEAGPGYFSKSFFLSGCASSGGCFSFHSSSSAMICSFILAGVTSLPKY